MFKLLYILFVTLKDGFTVIIIIISDVNNGWSSDMSDHFYVAVGHLKIEI